MPDRESPRRSGAPPPTAARKPNDVAVVVVGLARTLRAVGVDAGPERVHRMVEALDVLDPSRRPDVYWAGRLTLCGSADDVRRYDAAFDSYFGERPANLVRRPAVLQAVAGSLAASDGGGDDGAGNLDAPPVPAAASRLERLRHRDVTGMTAAERRELARLLAVFRMPGETRRTRRTVAARRGAIDRRRTVRELLRSGGEPVSLRFQTRSAKPRRVVLLLDVSGSMSGYADTLLRFAHAAGAADHTRVEAFTFSTRLTRVTRELAHRDPDLAMAQVSSTVPDWGGGTRLGEMLQLFLDQWGQRGMARGAVVVVLSDGWERGDPTLLGEQMARLHRLAHRVVWANPRKAQPGYAPLAAGMAAALPHVDDFVAGHNLAALEQLAAVVAHSNGHADVTAPASQPSPDVASA